MTDQPSDAGLSRDYDPTAAVREQQQQLDAEERRVTSQPLDDDPGADHVVEPPVEDPDDAGYDPTPPVTP